MAELLGAISAISSVNQLLDTAITLVKHFRRAYKRQKDSIPLFLRYLDELSHIREITRVIEEEAALQTGNVNKTIVRLKETGDALVTWLEKKDPEKKGVVRQFSHQLLHGSNDEKSLNDIMAELSRLKGNLTMYIQVAHVGVTQGVGDTVIANGKAVREIDEKLVLQFGKGKGLKIAELLKGRSPRSDGSVHLRRADAASLDSEETRSTDGSELGEVAAIPKQRAIRKRRVIRNTAHPLAIQINVPIEIDDWKDMDEVEISYNVAEGASKQFNYPMSLEAFKAALSAVPREAPPPSYPRGTKAA